MSRNRGTGKTMAQKKRTLLKKITYVFILLLGVYIIWCTVVWNRQPTITVDYVAMQNAKALSVDNQDAALPLYIDAAIAFEKDPEPSSEDYDLLVPYWPHQGGWEMYIQWIHRNSKTFELIREASGKTGLGVIIGAEPTDKDKKLFGEDLQFSFFADEQDSQLDQLMHGSLLNTSLPYLGTFRSLARMLVYDARQGAFKGDQSRFVSDVEAMLKLARHCKETPALIPDLVAMSIAKMSLRVTGEVLALSPEIFDDEHLTRLSNLYLDSGDLFHIRLETERVFLLDSLQRLYTDDGNGDGSLIAESMSLMEFITSANETSLPWANTIFSFLSGPLVTWNVASRKDALAEYDRRMDYYAEQSTLPLYARQLNDQFFSDEDGWWSRSRFVVVDVLAPVFGRSINSESTSLAVRNSIVAVIAMELYQRAEGKWPTRLAQAMENPPLDPWSGEPMQIAFEDGRPLIYSFGVDRNDDGGTFYNKRGQNYRSPWAEYLEPERMFSDHEGYSANRSNEYARDWQPADSEDLPDGDWILWPPIVD